MNKFLLCFISVLFFNAVSFAAIGDTTILVTHSKTKLKSPPKNYDMWTVIPDSGKTYQKILMTFTLGCDTPCSHWDYTVNADLGKKSGALDSSITAIDTVQHDTTWAYTEHVDYIETGRLITPYGTYMDANQQGFNRAWNQPFYYDVTDYAEFLKDSVAIRVHYDGWSDGFTATVTFMFIEGPPTRTVQSVREIYHSYYGYANSTDFESQVAAKTFFIDSNVTSAKVIVNMTGHGSQGEFDPHTFFIKVNNAEVYSHLLWKDDCDVNPVSPQGGTWIFHRANWCPGDKVPIYETDISPYITAGQNVTLDLDFDDFTIQGGQGAGYGISAHLITYTSQKVNDVKMEEIIAPNSDKTYLHWNPISTKPKVKIKNMGSNNLAYAEISYWGKGGSKWYYEWHGNLAPFETEQITLPAFDWGGLDTTDRVFYSEAKWPNQVPDEYAYNNKLQSSFEMTPKLDSVFFIYFKTNNHPEENWYIVQNEDGDTMDIKTTFPVNTILRDTLHLAPGSYTFDMNDYDNVSWGCGDGLKFFLNQQDPPCPPSDPCYETTGLIKLYKMTGAVSKNFTSEFGANIHYEFTVGYSLGSNPYKVPPVEPVHNTGMVDLNLLDAAMNVFPNPAKELINIQIDLNQDADGVIMMSDISGRTIREFHVNGSSKYFVTIPSSELAKGMYFINFVSNGKHLSRKIVVQ